VCLATHRGVVGSDLGSRYSIGVFGLLGAFTDTSVFGVAVGEFFMFGRTARSIIYRRRRHGILRGVTGAASLGLGGLACTYQGSMDMIALWNATMGLMSG